MASKVSMKSPAKTKTTRKMMPATGNGPRFRFKKDKSTNHDSLPEGEQLKANTCNAK
ncbi:hypothetical protein [Niastella populi]|uniref:hypothetical protein n=1 Tax=Niastella populi TaxID=550983 RepID=UPI0013FDEFE7|nr:hypothetical protein [Niastella populi]